MTWLASCAVSPACKRCPSRDGNRCGPVSAGHAMQQDRVAIEEDRPRYLPKGPGPVALSLQRLSETLKMTCLLQSEIP